jgi:hypothetical protein
MLGDDGLDPLDFAGPDGDYDGAHLGHRRKRAQAVDQNRHSGKSKKLFGGVRRNLPRRHAGAEPCSRKNHEDTHKKLSIPGQVKPSHSASTASSYYVSRFREAEKEGTMARARSKRVLRGTLAGIAGGLAASWVMNVFITSLGGKITQSLMSDKDKLQQQLKQKQKQQNPEPEEDATMKAAEGIVHAVTRGRHLSLEERKQAGPVVHYAFGALVGGLYGALAECTEWTSVGFGTVFGALLFATADLAAVPAFGLGPSVTEQPLATQAAPLAAHLVYGATTDLVRRAIRAAA